MKNKKVLKIILVFIAVIVCLYAIFCIRNYLILNKIFKQQEAVRNSQNYYFITENYSVKEDELKTVIEHFYKDKKHKIIYVIENEFKTTRWYDEDTKEVIIQVNDEKPVVETADFILGNDIPFLKDKSQAIKLYMTAMISSENMNDKDCYKIKISEKTWYIYKDNGMMARETEGYTIIDNVKHYRFINYRDWKFDQLKDNDIEK